MSEITRRNWLALAGASYLAGALDLEAAQHVHNAVAEAKKTGGPYAGRRFKFRPMRSPTRSTEARSKNEPVQEMNTIILLTAWVAAAAPEYRTIPAARVEELTPALPGGGVSGRYSSLTQINRENVNRLEV